MPGKGRGWGTGPWRDPGAKPLRKQYHVHLTPDQRAAASALLARGTATALTARHARILLEADTAVRRRVRSDVQVAERCGVSPRTVARVRQRFARDGFAVAVQGCPHPGSPPKLSSTQEARLIALVCTAPPAGRARWSVRLLAERAVELEELPPLSRELVRTTLKKTASNRGASNAG
ncbi:MAG TPA: helix-turn-helix domain-containing protein [Thermomicrobiales bacterium]|jgi:transposase|nr:helix-turn-helix domain-containing protein [Thermomicrobiales bacterium]